MKGFQASVTSMAIVIAVAIISIDSTLCATHLPSKTGHHSDVNVGVFDTVVLDKPQLVPQNDPHGDKLLVSTRYSWENSDWQPTFREIYDYNGKLVQRRTLERWSDSLFTFSSRSTYDYFTDGRLWGTTFEVWDSLGWRYLSQSIASFDESGRVVELLGYKWSGVVYQWTPSSRLWSFYIDELLAAETTFTSDGWSWFYSSNYQYSYDQSGHMTECTWQDNGQFSDNWENFWQLKNAYSPVGLLSESTELYWVEGAWINSARSTHEYDEKGNDTLAAAYTWKDDSWELTDIDTTRFDEANRIVERISFRAADSYLKKENYTYDDRGNLVEQVSIYSHNGGPLRNGGRMIYQYETTTTVEENESPLPTSVALRQNYPNPFNPATDIEYEIATSSEVNLTVFNILGQTIKILKTGFVSAGIHNTSWDGTDSEGNPVASGVYFYRLTAGDNFIQRKMLLLR